MDRKTKKSQEKSKAIKTSAVWSRKGTATKNKKAKVAKTQVKSAATKRKVAKKK